MAYDPTAPTEGERSVAYYFVGTGAVANTVLLAAQLAALPRWMTGVCIMAVAVSLLVATFSSRNDDYFRHLSFTASRFAMGVIAIWFCLAAVTRIGNAGYFVGELAAGVEPAASIATGPASWFTAEILAIAVAMAFHGRFVVERYRK
jgi:hypothetical protein